MLYQPKPRTTAATLARRALGAIIGVLACVARTHSDDAYLDGMRDRELQDLGLRRGDDGGYRPFN